mgnify:CR=1 FL=1
MEFAVWHEGIADGQGRWVLAVDAAGERFLLSDDERGFYWAPIAECKFAPARGTGPAAAGAYGAAPAGIGPCRAKPPDAAWQP